MLSNVFQGGNLTIYNGGMSLQEGRRSYGFSVLKQMFKVALGKDILTRQ